LKLADVTVPICSVACETDHIAAWKTCYRGVQQMGSASKTFIMTQSGHIAGIVNPPSRNKYGHYINEDMSGDPAAWLEGANFSDKSWWPRWESWLKDFSGEQIPARSAGSSAYPELCDAPGTYVKINARR